MKIFQALAFLVLLRLGATDGPITADDIPDRGEICKCQLPDTVDNFHDQFLSKTELLAAVQGPGYAGAKGPTGPPDEGGFTPWTMEASATVH